ncbi:MAG: 4-demethylwyosine synthase TYW1 [Methanotrichaceae archaeon]|nr:4-demethylwyosine synthase TYW1 [Methanotrichaceae archaeon]
MDRRGDPTRIMLAKQGYHLIGLGAVKPCLWLNRSLRGEDQCYKHYFYGISSHRCVQMTPTLQCNHLCLHCWRPIDDSMILGDFLEPRELLDAILNEQQRILSGYGGSEKTDLMKLREARKPSHIAISLMGEPTLYPYLKELVDEIRNRRMTSFVVTNGTKPEVLQIIRPTQLYLSLNAPTENVYMRIANPLGKLWGKILESLIVLKDHPSRTVVRITLIRNLNMEDPLEYAELLEKAEPNFVEVKAYMHLGRSRKRLGRENMPSHNEVMTFAEKLAHTMDYELSSHVPISRVALLSSKERTNAIDSV